jgi:hypothetical protein
LGDFVNHYQPASSFRETRTGSRRNRLKSIVRQSLKWLPSDFSRISRVNSHNFNILYEGGMNGIAVGSRSWMEA